MSFVLGIILSLGGLLFGIVLWKKLPSDVVGKKERMRRKETGFHGQLTEWIYWDAPLDPPRINAIGDQNVDRSARIGDRALMALLHRLSAERQVSVEEAHGLLLMRARSPRDKAFLAGRMARAVRYHWYARFKGPDLLFYPWYYLVAMVRYGRRHLYLDTLSTVLQELRKE